MHAFDPAFPPESEWSQVRIYSIEMHTYEYIIQKTCTNMLIATVFIIKNQKQLKWINNGGIFI